MIVRMLLILPKTALPAKPFKYLTFTKVDLLEMDFSATDKAMSKKLVDYFKNCRKTG